MRSMLGHLIRAKWGLEPEESVNISSIECQQMIAARNVAEQAAAEGRLWLQAAFRARVQEWEYQYSVFPEAAAECHRRGYGEME